MTLETDVTTTDGLAVLRQWFEGGVEARFRAGVFEFTRRSQTASAERSGSCRTRA